MVLLRTLLSLSLPHLLLALAHLSNLASPLPLLQEVLLTAPALLALRSSKEPHLRLPAPARPLPLLPLVANLTSTTLFPPEVSVLRLALPPPLSLLLLVAAAA